MKKVFYLVVLLMMVFASCTFEALPEEKIEFSGGKSDVVVDLSSGENTYQIQLSKSISGVLTYKSSNEKVADVDKQGLVTFKSPGSATITVNRAASAEYSFLSEALVFLVEGEPLAAEMAITLLSSVEYLNIGDTIDIVATINNASGTPKVIWDVTGQGVVSLTTSNNIATVTGLEKGSIELVAKIDGTDKAAVCTIVVSPVGQDKTLHSLAFVEKVNKVFVGKTQRLSVKTTPSSNIDFAEAQLKVEFDKSPSGLSANLVIEGDAVYVDVTAKSKSALGTHQLYVFSDTLSKFDSCVVSVIEPTVDIQKIDPKHLVIDTGTEEIISITVADASQVGDIKLTLDDKYLSSELYQVTGNTVQYKIIAKSEPLSLGMMYVNGEPLPVTIVKALTGIKIINTQESRVLSLKDELVLTVQKTPADASVDAFEWTSDDTLVAKVSGSGTSTGLVEAMSAGTAKITATSGNIKDTFEIVVSDTKFVKELKATSSLIEIYENSDPINLL
ncbi:MAG: Ig-like domain-containing protein, partial [Treponemataceae bacterium]